MQINKNKNKDHPCYLNITSEIINLYTSHCIFFTSSIVCKGSQTVNAKSRNNRNTIHIKTNHFYFLFLCIFIFVYLHDIQQLSEILFLDENS
jgi:hypothetical protein